MSEAVINDSADELLPGNAGVVADFSVQGDNLWVVANGQLHQLNIPTLARGRDIPRIRLTSLRVNDQTRSLSEVGSFSSGERRFEAFDMYAINGFFARYQVLLEFKKAIGIDTSLGNFNGLVKIGYVFQGNL